MVKIACTIVKNKKLVEAGDNVVISAGVPFVMLVLQIY